MPIALPWAVASVAEAEIIFSESLEQLASYNGADMHKYNLIYTFKINQHVLTPESYYRTNVPITQKNPCTLN